MRRFWFIIMVLTPLASLVIIAASIAATTSRISPLWFIPGDLVLVGILLVAIVFCGIVVFEKIQDWYSSSNSSESSQSSNLTDSNQEYDEEHTFGGSKRNVQVGKFVQPHPKDPRLQTDCYVCMDKIQRDQVSIRMCVLEDDMVALDIVPETLVVICPRCKYPLHAECALQLLVRSGDCMLCKKPMHV